MLLKAFAWQSNNMHLVNKGADPVHRRLDFLDEAVGNGSRLHLPSMYRRRFPNPEVYFAVTASYSCAMSSDRHMEMCFSLLR